MDTRVSVYLLLDYQTYYGHKKTLADAITLIKDIPSTTLINYISGINVNLYLHDNDEYTGKLQFQLVDSLLGKCTDEARKKWVEVIKKEGNNGFMPILFYNYSNLLFYNIIFENYNDYQCRDLTSEEAQRFFDAYLIINECVNDKYQIDYSRIENEVDNGNIENVIIPYFIYQRDYDSTLDFKNQVFRGGELFSYLEKDATYGKYVSDYYKDKNVSGYLYMYKCLMIIISHIGIEKQKRLQLIDLYDEITNNLINEKYLDSLCVNGRIDHYTENHSFKTLREKPLYKFDQYRFFVLDINFLFDHIYKAHIFSLNSFIQQKGGGNNFLSDKGKFFIEEIYLPKVLDKCFPNYDRYYSSLCKDSNGEELCDAYIRDNDKICIIECKDVLLNADIKNSGDRKKLFDESDKKFVKNEKGKQKGITQLFNAVKDINDNSVSFDSSIKNEGLEIFPVIIYTDNSFGIEGLNKYYRELFENRIKGIELKVKVHPIVFINLSYFEKHYKFYANNQLNIWDMLDKYNDYVKDHRYELTPFEIYSRFYINSFVTVNDDSSDWFQECLSLIMKA